MKSMSSHLFIVVILLSLLGTTLSFICTSSRSMTCTTSTLLLKPTSVRRIETTHMSTHKEYSSMVAVGPKQNGKLWSIYLKTTDTLTTLFPLWTVLFAGLALARPQSFVWFTTNYFTGVLGNACMQLFTRTPLIGY